MFVRSLRGVVVPLVVVVVACSGGDSGGKEGSATQSSPMPAADASGSGSDVVLQYAPELGVDLSTMAKLPSGLYMKDIAVGEGDIVVNGNKVQVRYTGWLPNGAQFDSNRDSQEPLSFFVGNGDVIKGWEEGLLGMRRGGRRMLVIPPDLAYGDRGLPGVIPPNSTLVFDVTLVAIVAQ